MKKLITTALFIMLITIVYGQTTFIVDGIEYTTNGTSTVKVVSINYTGDISIPFSVIYNETTYTVTSIEAFNGCDSLTSITLPNSVTSIGDEAFFWCSSLTQINVDNSNFNYSSIGGVLFNKDQTILIKYPAGNTSTTYTVPNSVTSIDSNAFLDCSSLTSITIPNSITSIGSHAFSFCPNLTTISLPNSVTSIGEGAFSNCHSLTNITLPNSVTFIENFAFYGCGSLTSITIPNSVTSIGIDAFSHCSLTSITIPNSVNSILLAAFWGCSGLTSITLPNSVTSIESQAFSGCSSLTSITIPNSVTSIESQTFYGCSSLTSITIPNSVTSIGDGAFWGCSSLLEIICFADEPPRLGSSGFSDGVNSDMIIKVPESSVLLYQNTSPWNEFKIMPISNKIARLEVSLPPSASDGQYMNMTLEMINNTSKEKVSIVTNKNLSYSFAGLSLGDTCSILLKDRMGLVLGEIKDIKINSNPVKVIFTDLRELTSVNLVILDDTGNDVTHQVKVSWYDNNNSYICAGTSIPGQSAGSILNYQVDLNSTLGMKYAFPAKQAYTVVSGSNSLQVMLQPIAKVTINGCVKDTAGNPLSEALVIISQQLNGKYPVLTTGKTENDGNFSLTVFNEESTIIISSPDHISNTINKTSFNGATDFGVIILDPISGAAINTELYYRRSVDEGQPIANDELFTDYQNLKFTLFNITQKKPITDFSFQYPDIILSEDAYSGDSIRIGIEAYSNYFEPLSAEGAINDSLKAKVRFTIVQQGSIKATYKNSEKASNVAILYDAKGQFVKRLNYFNSSIQTGELPDGSYSLVSMSYSPYFNSILNISELTAVGLKKNSDYVVSTVEVKSGVIKNLSISSIPAFDESKLYYTGSNTLFSANKSSVVIGSYLILRGQIDFKDSIADRVTNVKLLVDLPDSCAFFPNSLMIGAGRSAYSFSNGRLTIPLSNFMEIVRFCVIPTQAGTYLPNAFVEFDLDGKTISQPIGSANFEATDFEFIVPSRSSQKSIIVRGKVVSNAQITIYDNETMVGQTKSRSDETWSLEFELVKPYTFSNHNIRAEIQTITGQVLRPQTKQLIYNSNGIDVSKVIMIHASQNVVFDFIKQVARPTFYTFIPGSPQTTFIVDFTKNDTSKISNVIVNVTTSSGNVFPLPATYNNIKKVWVAAGNLDTYNMPTNVNVDYIDASETIFDRNYINDATAGTNNAIYEFNNSADSLDSISVLIQNELLKDDYNESKIDSLLRQMQNISNIHIPLDTAMVEVLSRMDSIQFYAHLDSLYSKIDSLEANSNVEQYKEFFSNPKYFENLISLNDSLIHITSKTCEGLVENNLESQGFVKFLTSDSSYIYFKNTENEWISIDFKRNLYQILRITQLTKSFNLNNNFLDIQNLLAQLRSFMNKSEFWIDAINVIVDRRIEKIEVDIEKSRNHIKQIKAIIKNGPYRFPAHEKLLNKLNLEIKTLNGLIKSKKTYQNFSAVLETITLSETIKYAYNNANEYIDLYNSIDERCTDDQLKAILIKGHIMVAAMDATNYYVNSIKGSIASLALTYNLIKLNHGAGILASIGFTAAKELDAKVYINQSKGNKRQIQSSLSKLKCHKELLWLIPSGGPGPVTPIFDPSGFIYEAVSSNRVEGVTATVFYKTWEEDIYGEMHEKIVLWDAENYGQTNPLLTDNTGVFAWDVPVGLWQVRYEKEGYQTMFTDWLPVPPPQLEVNISMVQLVQPGVKSMQGFESGVIIAFDKYMLPEYINTQNITVTQNEARINGSIEFIDEEANPKDPAEKYVSKLRFVPQVPFTVGDTLTVKVSYDVKSYAGLNMASDHIQKVIVEPELKSIIATENLKIDYTKTGRIEVSVLPKEVASGRKIFMKSNSPMIASVTDSVLLDTNGTATIDVKAELPGSANINITVERSSLKAEVAIEINMPAINQVKLGDSNEDGIVDEDDIINLINYIQAKNPNPFNFEASDINLNNTIDIADVVGIVSIIKNVTPPSVEINNGTLRLGNGLITMETSTPIGGFDFACNGDLKEMPDLKDYTVVRFMKDGNNRVLAYTMGQGISSGTLFTYNNQPTLSNLLFVDQIGNPVEMKLIFKSDIELNFNQGWNIFSINRLPANTDMKVLFQPLISADKLVKMQDENGNGFEVFGVFGGWTNNIGDISLTEGYKIKVNGNCNIVIDGASVVLPYNIPLKIGWNIISFPKQSVANGMAVVQQLIDRGTLIKVQGESGYSIENWGIFGGWQNTIGDFVPGEGYKIKVSKNDTLRIYDSYPKSSTELPDQNAVIHFSPEFEGNGIDHMNINLIGLLVNDFKAGDELAVFDGKTCVGAISVQQHHISDGFISIPVSAKDEYGDVGFTEGNPYRLKLWKKQSQAEYLIEDEIITGSSSFLKHESTFTSIKKLIVTGSDDYNLNGNSSVKCYPNPFKEGIIIETNLIDPEMMQIDVINQSGQLIKKILTITSLDPGIYFFNWDGRNEFGNNVPAGIYNLVMTDKSRKQYFKVLKIE